MALQYGEGGELEVTMEGPFASIEGGSTEKLATIHLPVSEWKGAERTFFQIVQVDEVSANSMVKLQASVEQLEKLQDMDLSFTAVNDAGVVTVYAVGDKPTEDWTLQATVVEVVA